MSDKVRTGEGGRVVQRVLAVFPSDLLVLVARVCLAFPFLVFGSLKIRNHDAMAGVVESGGIPGWFIWVVIPYQLLSAAGVLLGFHTRLCAFLLGGFCIAATALYHNSLSDLGELSSFTKDIAVAGGFVALWLYGPGRYSIDRAQRRGIGPA
jgi:putative oxidoreductase